ncbi:MAG TPA: DUF192 domain-containing protein [Acidimicrobiales bacterium]|nr:DUF192 domain-containing protein [Acidimicrobiales bacterium]
MSGAHSKRRTLADSRKALGWAVIVVAVLGLGAFLTVGANGPADPHLRGLPGFGEVAFKVTGAATATSAGQYCALLADTEQQRAKGLMGRRDLAGYDAMVFRFDTDSAGGFYMRDVPVDLSIAWFGADGRFVSSTDMASCPDQDGCPTYTPAGPYRLAVEVLKGGLDRLGIGQGSMLTVGGACRR